MWENSGGRSWAWAWRRNALKVNRAFIGPEKRHDDIAARLRMDSKEDAKGLPRSKKIISGHSSDWDLKMAPCFGSQEEE